MFVHVYSENVPPNSLMNLFQVKYMLSLTKLFLYLIRQTVHYIATV